MAEWLPAVIASIISFIGGLATSRANASAVNVKTFQDLIAQVQALSTDLKIARQEASDEIEKVRDELDRLDDKNRVLWQYVYALIEQVSRHEHPLKPPKELESDPKLMKMIQEFERGRAKK
jgi:hypothetical protein